MQLLQATPADPAHADLRQLRHHTKNALARILAQLSCGLSQNEGSRAVAADLERRILLTAEIADALFGFTRSPDPFASRLAALCNAVLELIGEGDQHLTLCCTVRCDVPPQQQETVLRIAHEFVANAVKHGMPMRLIGRIEVSVTASPDHVVLEVLDDGWGCGGRPVRGEGMAVANALAAAIGGSISLERRRDCTVARLELPSVRHDA